MIPGLLPLEKAVLEMLLAGDEPGLAILRAQLEGATLRERHFSGVGFFCDFTVQADAPRLEEPRDFALGDVYASVNGLLHGAGFVLFVREGLVEMLEGFSYDEPWPEQIGEFELTYDRVPREWRRSVSPRVTDRDRQGG